MRGVRPLERDNRSRFSLSNSLFSMHGADVVPRVLEKCMDAGECGFVNSVQITAPALDGLRPSAFAALKKSKTTTLKIRSAERRKARALECRRATASKKYPKPRRGFGGSNAAKRQLFRVLRARRRPPRIRLQACVGRRSPIKPRHRSGATENVDLSTAGAQGAA